MRTVEELAASLCEFHRKSGFSGECGYCAEALLVLRAVRAEAWEEQHKRCMAIQCRFCAMEWEAHDQPGWGWYHFNADGGPDQKCEAAAIRALGAGGTP